MLKEIWRYYHTLRHLRAIQVIYQVRYLVRNKTKRDKKFDIQKSPVLPPTCPLVRDIPSNTSYNNGTFTFTGLSHRFKQAIDWNFPGHGKLWSYNLNYFDFLHQEGFNREEGTRLMHNFNAKLTTTSVGLDPYPTSLRGINWIKFITKHHLTDQVLIDSLYTQYKCLSRSLEYHLLGNHLLENAFSLFFAGCFFGDDGFKKTAAQLLSTQLREQILEDGAHFELSPMYHQTILHRILDCINFHRSTGDSELQLEQLLVTKAAAMLGWLNHVTYCDGSIPMVNDAAANIAPSTAGLNQYAGRLGLSPENHVGAVLSQSGYRKVNTGNYELFMDAGNIGPDYIPGHAHADTFSFEMHINRLPFIVDTGTSTYENNDRRHLERSTRSHNTVMFNNLDQSDVWASHRVGERARVQVLEDTTGKISARHNGYRKQGVYHTRTFEYNANGITITDNMDGAAGRPSVAFFHFYPGIVPVIKGESVITPAATLTFVHAQNIRLADYLYASGFNSLVPAVVAEITFESALTTSIKL